MSIAGTPNGNQDSESLELQRGTRFSLKRVQGDKNAAREPRKACQPACGETEHSLAGGDATQCQHGNQVRDRELRGEW